MTTGSAILRLDELAIEVTRGIDLGGEDLVEFESSDIELDTAYGPLIGSLRVDATECLRSFRMGLSAGAEIWLQPKGAALMVDGRPVTAFVMIGIDPISFAAARVDATIYDTKADRLAFGVMAHSDEPELRDLVADAASKAFRSLVQKEPKLLRAFLAAASTLHADDLQFEMDAADARLSLARDRYFEAIENVSRLVGQDANRLPLSQNLRRISLERLGIEFHDQAAETTPAPAC